MERVCPIFLVFHGFMYLGRDAQVQNLVLAPLKCLEATTSLAAPAWDILREQEPNLTPAQIWCLHRCAHLHMLQVWTKCMDIFHSWQSVDEPDLPAHSTCKYPEIWTQGWVYISGTSEMDEIWTLEMFFTFSLYTWENWACITGLLKGALG